MAQTTSNGGLIFPVTFDLETAVGKASGDAERVLRRMQTAINARPLMLGIQFKDDELNKMLEKLKKARESITFGVDENGNKFVKNASGSLDAIRVELEELSKRWNALSQSQRIVNRETGEYTKTAQAIIDRYAELVAAGQSYAKSLAQIARESRKASDEELKRIRKAAEAQAVQSSQARTLDEVATKMKLVAQLMSGVEQGSAVWKTLAGQMVELREQQTLLQAVQKAELSHLNIEYTAVIKLANALRDYGNTIAEIQTKLGAMKETMTQTTVGGAAFKEANIQLKQMNEELEIANQLVKNFQAASLKGLTNPQIMAQTDKMAELENRIRGFNEELNRLNLAGNMLNGDGTLTKDAMRITEQRIAAERELQRLRTDSAKVAQKAYEDEIKADAQRRKNTAERQRQIEAEREAKRADYENLVRQLREEERLSAEKARQAALDEKIRRQVNTAERVRQIQAERDAREADYNALVRQLREEERLSAEKARQRDLELRKQRQGETLAALEAERQARQKLIEQKRRQLQQENEIISRQAKSLADVQAQLSVWQSKMGRASFGGAWWQKCLDNVVRLTQKLAEMQAVQDASTQKMVNESAAVRSLIQNLNQFGDTLGQLQTRLSALQQALSKASIGKNAFYELSMEIRKVNEELQRAQQLAQDYQNKAFLGLGNAKTKQQVAEVTRLRDEISQLDKQMNRIHQLDSMGKGKPDDMQKMIGLINQRIALEEKLNNILTTGAEVAKKSLDEQIAAQKKFEQEWLAAKDAHGRKNAELNAQQQAEASRSRQNYNEQKRQGLEIQRILNSQTMSYDALSKKLQILESLRNKSQVGSQRWDKTTKQIELTRRLLKAITDEMNRAAKTAERLRKLREIFSMSEKSMAGLNARLGEYNARLQTLDVGTDKFNRTAYIIATLSEELRKATQYAQDFAQAAFRGLGADWTTMQVQSVARLRAEIDRLDQEFNRLHQSGASMNANGTLTSAANDILRERKRLVKELNDMTLTAADAQAKREKEINRTIEQRRAKAEKERAARQKILDTEKRRREENNRIRQILSAQENTVNAISAKLQVQQNRLNSTNMGSKKFERIAKEVERLTKALEVAQTKIAGMTGQTDKLRRKTRNLNIDYNEQLTYIDRLIRRMVVYGSIGMVTNFLTKIKDVTAQFELQRISLGAILQDQNKANQLFAEIKSFALKSPVSILDLTKYTKQLAAYKIGYEELFDTTKRLTDVSVGLGVTMDRVVLAYGQVRATGHLRASEIRQFTEMGVPIVEELAAKLTKLNGEAVTAADVMDMVSKRMISFDLVKQVFDDMTSAGGIFFNMQEKQGNTLYGLWAKLADAASVMYSEIGNTSVVNWGLRAIAEQSATLMRNWKNLVGVVASLGAGLIAFKAVSSLTTINMMAATRAAHAQTKAMIQLNAANKSGIALSEMAATASLKAAKANRVAALSANFWTAAKYRLIAVSFQLKAFFASNWIGLLAIAIGMVVTHVANLVREANKLKNALADIKNEASASISKSAQNFKSLANTAVKAADGSREQTEALKELERTYRDIIPAEDLKIEKLRAMKGDYDALIAAIHEYNTLQARQKGLDEINQNYDQELLKKQRKIAKDMGEYFDERQISRIMARITNLATTTNMKVRNIVAKAFKEEGLGGKDAIKFWSNDSEFGGFVTTLREKERDIKNWITTIEGGNYSLGKFGDALNQAKEDIKNFTFTNPEDTYAHDKEYVAAAVGRYTQLIEEEFKKAQIDVDFASIFSEPLSKIDFAELYSAIDASKFINKEMLKSMVKSVQKEYEGLVPQSSVVRSIRGKCEEIADSMGVSMDKVKTHMMNAGEKAADYRDRLKGVVEDYKKIIMGLQVAIANSPLLSPENLDAKAQLQKTEAIKDVLEAWLALFPTEEKSGRGSDTRLQSLQEISQTLATINKEYSELVKKEGETKALAEIQEQFADTLAYTNRLGAKFGLNFKVMPTEFKTLQEYRREILKVMETLKNLKGGERAILDFRSLVSKADIDELQRLLEQRLKDLSHSISRTKTAREFYQKILSQTGDADFAANAAESIFGSAGKDLFDQMVEQIRLLFVDKETSASIDLSDVIDFDNERINYQKLSNYLDRVTEANRDAARQIVETGQKAAASQIETWEKELAKAKDFEQKRTDVVNRETQRRSDIIKSNLGQDEKDRLIGLSYAKQREELSKLSFDEFKNSDDYIKIFENLDKVSTPALKRLRAEMEKLKLADKGLSPENMKALVKAMGDIDKQLNSRGVGNVMIQSAKDYAQAAKDLVDARTRLKEAQADYQSRELSLSMDIQSAKAEEALAQQEVDRLREQGLLEAAQGVAAQERLNRATERVAKAEERKAKAAKRVADAEKEVTDQQDRQRKAVSDFMDDLGKVGQLAGELADEIARVKDLLGLSENSVEGLIFDSAVSSLQQMSAAIQVATAAQAVFNAIAESNPYVAAAAGVMAVGSAVFSFISSNKVRRANKEIKRQQQLLDQLEYSYERLNTQAEKLFGADYLTNHNQQLRNLQMQQTAYLKQAEAERSKGKKKDKDKIKEYEEQARETADKIKELQEDLVSHIVGTDVASAARDFADAWLDAYLSFDSTTDAIKSKFDDMIKNMVVNSLLAGIVQRSLQPLFDEIDRLASDGRLSSSDIASVMSQLPQYIGQIDSGMKAGMEALRAAGFDINALRDRSSEFTGIAKNVASASSEEINAVAAIGNTLMYYNGYLPTIAGDVAAIRAVLGAGSGDAVSSTEMQDQAMRHYAAIEANTAATVARLSEIVTRLDRVITNDGGRFGIRTIYGK